MAGGHVDPAHHVIALPDHPHHLGRLDEIEGLRRCEELLGDSTRIARRLSRERKPALSRADVLVRLLHLLRRPGFQHWVFGVADMRRHLTRAVAIAVEGMGRVLPYRTAAQSRWRVVPIHSEHEPGKLGRRELGY